MPTKTIKPGALVGESQKRIEMLIKILKVPSRTCGKVELGSLSVQAEHRVNGFGFQYLGSFIVDNLGT